MESKGLKMIARKTEVMVNRSGDSEEVIVCDRRGDRLKQVDKFRYLGSIINGKGGCSTEVRERVKAAWCKWREMGGVVCDKKMPALLKAQVYKTVVRPVLVYAAETWALSKKESELLERTKMRMLRWILGVGRRDRIRNENIRKRLKVLCITEKIRTTRLRWADTQKNLKKKEY